MPLELDEAITRDKTLESWVRSANNILNEQMANYPEEVTADWRSGLDEQCKPIIILTLRDDLAAVFARFSPDELTGPDHMRDRLRRVWRDLLQASLKKQLRSLHAMIQSNGEE